MNYKIALLKGDGIGPEIVDEAVKVLNKIGEKLQNKYNINWLYSDFKKKDGYKQSILLSQKYNLYRQDYCGCKYSKPH